MKFDRKKFFDGFRERLDPTIEPEQVDGLEFLLKQMESDPFWKHIPQIAYALATVFHETAGSFQPVEEGYYLGSAAKVKRFQKTLRYYPYFGRGYVQLTWKANYAKAGKAFGVDLVKHPEKAKDPEIAYKTLTLGMHQGWFTGKKLDDYIKGAKKDYVNARRIINGTDKAGLIAGYARSFEKILTDSAAAVSSAKTPAIANSGDSNQSERDASLTAANAQNTTAAADNKQATETSVTQEQGGTTVELTAKNEQTVHEPAQIEAPPPQGLFKKLSAGVGTLFGGTLIYTALERFGAMSFSTQAIIVICFVIFVAFLAFMFWAAIDAWKQAQRVKAEIAAKTDIHRKDVEWV